jgi:hypothetical protein
MRIGAQREGQATRATSIPGQVDNPDIYNDYGRFV